MTRHNKTTLEYVCELTVTYIDGENVGGRETGVRSGVRHELCEWETHAAHQSTKCSGKQGGIPMGRMNSGGAVEDSDAHDSAQCRK